MNGYNNIFTNNILTGPSNLINLIIESYSYLLKLWFIVKIIVDLIITHLKQ